MRRIALQAVIYALATGALAILLSVSHLVYGEVFGGSPSRGISVGLSMELVLTIHLLINLAMAFIPKTLFKGTGIIVFVVATLYLLLPTHPVRAMFMAGSGAMLSALAILVGAKVVRRA